MTAEDYKNDDSKKTDFQRRELSVAAKLHRRGTALCVNISQDRGDISAATFQLATSMRTPTEYDWERLERVCRHLQGSEAQVADRLVEPCSDLCVVLYLVMSWTRTRVQTHLRSHVKLLNCRLVWSHAYLSDPSD